MLTVNGDRLLRTINELGKIGAAADGGITRLCLSSEDVKGKKYVLNLMEDAGLSVSVDPVVNLVGLLGDQSSRPVIAGSHTDTVVNAGRLDGSYGVLAAIESARTIKESGLKLSHPIAVVCFCNEEGVRFPGMTGSRFITNQMTLDEAYGMHDSEGKPFKDCAVESGFKMTGNTSSWEKGAVDSYVELHIEQGPVLEEHAVDVGVVEGIVGVSQYAVSVDGSADHAGTTPMSKRRDALVAAARMIIGVGDLAREADGAVGTVGRLSVFPNAPNVIPGRVEMTIDFRHKAESVLRSAGSRIELLGRSVSDEVGAAVSVSPRMFLPPKAMTPRIMSAIGAASEELGLKSERIHSGAGHDAMVMGNVCDTGMIFVPSKAGKSHSPLEDTDPRDLVNGANMLLNTLVRLASS